MPDEDGKSKKEEEEGGRDTKKEKREFHGRRRPGALGGTMKAGCTISSLEGIQDRARNSGKKR